MIRRRIGPARSLAGMLAATGVLHFVAPEPFDTIVPHALPGPRRRWTYLSGVVELGVAAALFVAVFPANVQMALAWRDRPLPYRAAAWARLPLQIPLIAWALRASRDHPGRS